MRGVLIGDEAIAYEHVSGGVARQGLVHALVGIKPLPISFFQYFCVTKHPVALEKLLVLKLVWPIFAYSASSLVSKNSMLSVTISRV